ncbi:MAG TPA: hypothetical protein VMG12_04080 [Polyangiaceae bacterium]|nr:hypothetical protein [Polyangiaceae bacterium]
MNDLSLVRRAGFTSRSRRTRTGAGLVCLLGVFGVLASACGDDDDDGTIGEPSVEGGGGSAEGGSSPALRDAVNLPDGELARDALRVLGSSAVGGEGSCSNCHTLGRPTLTRWSTLTRAFASDCLADTTLSSGADADAMLDCFQRHADAPAALAPADFGIYAAATHLPWFSFVFERAAGDSGDWRARHEQFVANVGMPRAGTLLTQEQFDVVAEWFARGLPELFDVVPEDDGEDCTSGLDPQLAAHIDQMESDGWRARNEQVPLLMFGCADGQTGADCLSDIPLASDDSNGFDWDPPGDARIRILYDNSARRSRFWSRTSPDGRYIASGLVSAGGSGFTGQFVDLERERTIPAAFSYDPTFFPDNSGFLVQRDGGYSSAGPGGGPTSGGADRGDVAVICEQSVLSDDPDEVAGDEDQCIALDSQIGLYQQLAKSIDGEDYWVVFGSYDSDNTGYAPVLSNPSAAFASDSKTTLMPMINQGTTFEPGPATRVPTPLQGDPMLSPSGRLMVTRVKGREYTVDIGDTEIVTADQSGYALHLVGTEQTDGEWSASITDVGRICKTGGKAVISYDERWMVFHHYITSDDAGELGFSGADDPDFDPYTQLGASDIYLVDLRDGSTRLITRMNPGEYALYPHFRSDGWIYFVVRTLDGDEYFAASDAALLLEDGARD